MEIRKQGGIPALLSCMESEDTEVIRYTVRALSILSIDGTRKGVWLTIFQRTTEKPFKMVDFYLSFQAFGQKM